MTPEDGKIPLIADPDIDFIGSIRSDTAESENPPILVSDGRSALEAINRSAKKISSVSVSPDIGAHEVSIVVESSLQYLFGAPVFMLGDHAAIDRLPEVLSKLNTVVTIQKPISFRRLQLITTVARTAKSTPLVFRELVAHNDGAVFEEANGDFIPVLAANVSYGCLTLFDVYAKLGPESFMKIFSAGSRLDQGRLERYRQNTNRYFYIRKSAQDKYLKFCRALVQQMRGPTEVSEKSSSIPQAPGKADQFLSALRTLGVPNETIIYAKDFVIQSLSYLTDLKDSSSEPLKSYCAKIAQSESAIEATAVAAIICRSLGFTHHRGVPTVGIASLLQDIGLNSLSQDIQTKFEQNLENQMSSEELVKYKSHPLLGAELLRSVKSLDPIVFIAIETHHERRSKQGFPRRLGANAISQVAEIIGLADDFARLLKRAGGFGSSVNPYVLAERKLLVEFSTPVAEAFRKAFKKF